MLPAGQAKKLGDWLGVKLNAQVVESNVNEFTRHMTSKTPQLSVERWKREMKPKLSDLITSELHDELIHFGYEV